MYKAVPLGSIDAQCDGAQKAISAEVSNMHDQHVYDHYSTARELHDVRRSEPGSLVVFCHLLLGVKNIEAMSSAKWKARLVAGGNNLQDGGGAPIYETDLYGSPTSLEAVRLVIWWSVMHPGHDLLQTDMRHAYLQTTLKGRPVHICLPKILWPAEWFKPDGEPLFYTPCLRLRKAMYGLRRSGFDWMAHAERILVAHQWIPIRDYVDGVFYKPTSKGPLLLCIYVDDLLASGHADFLHAALEELRV